MIYEDIKQQFNEVIAYSQGIPEPNTDELFERWLSAKRDFIEAFGGKLIYEVPVKVNFTLDDKDKASRFNEFVDVIYNSFSNEALGSFLEQEDFNSFFTNTVTKTYSKDEVVIPTGMKLIKAFKFFEKDKHMLETMQDYASRIIQENKIEGTLCFSVHPLDFLSSSENTYNWRSCHALDGEFRAGNLSYMVDPHTIMCYLKGADNVEIPLFPQSVPWNSKKWRMLLFFSSNWDMIFAGRQYPFSSDTALEVIRKEISLAIYGDRAREEAIYCDWSDIYITSENTGAPIDSDYVPVRGDLIKMTEIVHDAPRSLHYNDLLRSSTYLHPFYTIKDNNSWSRWQYSQPTFQIGGSVKCLHCGNHLISNSETMMCDDCEIEYGHEENDIYGVCDCCGTRIVRDDATWVGDELVCDACFAKECFICECCDEVFYTADRIYDKKYGEYTCPWCYEERRKKENEWQ